MLHDQYIAHAETQIAACIERRFGSQRTLRTEKHFDPTSDLAHELVITTFPRNQLIDPNTLAGFTIDVRKIVGDDFRVINVEEPVPDQPDKTRRGIQVLITLMRIASPQDLSVHHEDEERPKKPFISDTLGPDRPATAHPANFDLFQSPPPTPTST